MSALRSPNATPFLFGEDLRQPASARQAVADLERVAERQLRESIEREAFERGREAGRAEAEAEADRLRATALERLAAEAAGALGAIDARAAAIEDEALGFFVALADTLAGRAIAREPLAAIAEAAREAFRHLRGVPHLVARVHADLVEDVDAMLHRLAREHGFDGRIVVIGSDEIQPGDARLDWADGAVVTDRRAHELAIASVLSRAGIGDASGTGQS